MVEYKIRDFIKDFYIYFLVGIAMIFMVMIGLFMLIQNAEHTKDLIELKCIEYSEELDDECSFYQCKALEADKRGSLSYAKIFLQQEQNCLLNKQIMLMELQNG